jgi:hypothetical protein
MTDGECLEIENWMDKLLKLKDCDTNGDNNNILLVNHQQFKSTNDVA